MEEPDQEVAAADLSADTSLLVERAGRLVAAVELLSSLILFTTVSRTIIRSRFLLDEVRRELAPALESLDRGEGEVLNMDRVRDRVRQRVDEGQKQDVAA